MEVSDFLVYLLIDSRAMSTDGARRVAALWTKGTGQELRSFPPQMYFEIFGSEDGWMVYREVHMALHREKSKGFWYRNGGCKYCSIQHVPLIIRADTLLPTDILLASALCFEAIDLGVAVAGTDKWLSNDAGVWAMMAALFGGIACMAAIINVTVEKKGEKQIEKELRWARGKYDPSRS